MKHERLFNSSHGCVSRTILQVMQQARFCSWHGDSRRTRTVSLNWDQIYREMLMIAGISSAEIDDYGCAQVDGKSIEYWQPLDEALVEAIEQFTQR